jgi:SAM-dependent methyltransferase
VTAPPRSRLARLGRAAVRLVLDARFRDSLRMSLFRPPGGFQPFGDTAPNRYPIIFDFVRRQLGEDGAHDILSFGCSTGEEVITLRRYFPKARIKGIDINPRNIAACRRALRRQPDAGLDFAIASSTRGEPEAFYDAIFCMAVLRDGRLGRPGTTRCDPLLRFDDFAACIQDFARCLKPGGLLIVRHSNFRLCDAPAGQRFETLLRRELGEPGHTPLFGPDNRRLEGAVYPDTVFRKIASDRAAPEPSASAG